MAKKSEKKNGAPANAEKKPRAKKKAYVIREEHPAVVVPIALWAFVMILLGVGYRFGFLDRVLSLWTGSGVTLAAFIFCPLFYAKNYLYPKAFRPLLIALVIVGALCMGLLIFLAAWGQNPQEEFTITLSGSPKTLNLDSGAYALFIQGNFVDDVEPEQAKENDKDKSADKDKDKAKDEAKAKASKKKHEGSYTVSMVAKGSDTSKQFSGHFEHFRKYRKMSKKARGYQEVRQTSALDRFSAKAGAYSFSLDEASGDLIKEMEIRVYRAGYLPYLLMILGLIPIFLGNFVDQVIRNSRISSAIGPTVGAALGFAAYYYHQSSPNIGFMEMARSILIGSLGGIAVAYILAALTQKWYARFILKKGISL